MESALRKLQIHDYDMAPLGRLIGDWREALADHVWAECKKHRVDIRTRYPEDPDIKAAAPAIPPAMNKINIEGFQPKEWQKQA